MPNPTNTGHCPFCNAPEVNAETARTVYACGTSSYDDRPGTWEGPCSEPILVMSPANAGRFNREIDTIRAHSEAFGAPVNGLLERHAITEPENDYTRARDAGVAARAKR